jgi:uncharacterized protein YuzE
MKARYDPEADALSVPFADRSVVESEEVSEDHILDFDAEGRILAIEVLRAKKRLAEGIDFATLDEA